MSKRSGKGARSRHQEKRLQEKRARKAANKARYAELKRLGINGKSKRFKANMKRRRKAATENHIVVFCGNIGCKRCYPDINTPVF